MSSRYSTLTSLLQNRQHNRILRLAFPNSDGPQSVLLANRLEASESVSRDFTFTVEVLADNARIPLKAMQGKMVTIELVRGDGSLRYFNGYVFEFRLVKTDGSVAFYSMVLKPWLSYLKLRNNNFLFHDQTLRDQTETVFAAYGSHPTWDWRVTGNDLVATMACQFDESDHNYLHRRWEAAGWHYWYEHSATGHTLVLSDNSTTADPIDGHSEDVRFQRHGGSMEEEAIGSWSPVRQIVPGRVVLSAFNFKQPAPLTVDVPTLNIQGDVLAVESAEYAGAYGVKSSRHGDALGQLRMEEMEAAGKHMEAEGNNRFSMPGRWFRLAEHFHYDSADRTSGEGRDEFLILGMEHVACNNYLQLGDPAPDYSNSFTCIRKNIPWHPGRGYNSVETKIHGPQTAIVTGPAGQEIHTDEHGRVRVQFHWDREGQSDERSSAFVRVASSWASGNFGAISLPRVGDEVIVQWLDSNPDHPIITGRVYNGENMGPWDLPSQSALSGIRSSELKGASGGGRNNHLLMDDTSGQIQTVLSSDHNRSQLSLGYITRVLGTPGRKDHRGEGVELRTDGWGALRAAKGVLITAWGQAVQDEGTTQQDNTEGADTLRAVLDSAENRSQAAAMASDERGEKKHGHRGLDSQKKLEADSWSLSKPMVFISAPEGVAASTPKSIVHAAGEDLGNYAVGNLDMTAGKVMSFSAAKGIQQHVERGGISTAISHGDYHVHVQDGKTELVSQQGITIEAKTGSITLKTKGGSIVLTESGEILIKGKSETHDISGTLELGAAKVVNKGSVAAPAAAKFWGQMNVGKFSQQLILSSAMHMLDKGAGKFAYKLVGKDGAVLKQGRLDDEGKSERVFTEDMEELHAEVQVYDKWQFQEEVRHDIEADLDELVDDAMDDVVVPVGVGVLAEKANMHVGMVRDMFKPDGTIDPMSLGLAIFRDKLNLPTMAILDILRQRGDMRPFDALKVAAVDLGQVYVEHHANDYINESAAKLVSLMGGTWRGGELPQDVRGLFEQARTAREGVLTAARDKAQEAAYEVVLEASEELAVLSQGEPLAMELEEFLPADMRGGDEGHENEAG
jgi:type VI secretion system secreted protein VgrG